MSLLRRIAGPHRGRKRTVIVIALTLAVLWSVGLVRFVGRIPDHVADAVTRTDAIVVLTGGSRRVEAGLRLLADGTAPRVFISGVYPGTTAEELLSRQPISADAIACCVEIGREARDTAGNAIETATWLDERGVDSLRLVTAAYHMPRSLLEFRRVMPETLVVPHPVFPSRVDTEGWWRRPRTALLIAGEYTKYLVALARHSLGLANPLPSAGT